MTHWCLDFSLLTSRDHNYTWKHWIIGSLLFENTIFNNIDNLFNISTLCQTSLEDTDALYWLTISSYGALVLLGTILSSFTDLWKIVLLLESEKSSDYFSGKIDDFVAVNLSSLSDLWSFLIIVTTSFFQTHLMVWWQNNIYFGS